MNLAQLRTHTLERLDEDPTNPQSWTAAEVTAALNEAQMLLALLTLCLETKATITLSGLPFLSILDQLPDWIVPLRLRQGTAKVRPVRLADLDALNPQWSSVASGLTLQRYGSVGFGLLFLDPAPAGTAEVVYANAPAVLVLDTDIPAVPERTHPALIAYATYRLREKQGGSEFAAGLAGLSEFMAVAKVLGVQIRARSLGQRYDTLPVELTHMDLSRFLKLRKDLLPATAKEPHAS